MTSLFREQALAYRLRANHLSGERLPAGSLALAAASGLQDGSPRSALLSLAARVDGVGVDDWRAEGLAQVFGPRGAIYVVPESDIGVFTRGLLPRDPDRIARLEEIAARAHAVLAGGSLRQTDLLERLPGVDGRELRWAATLGTLVPVWDTVDTIVHAAPEPKIGLEEARLELTRRFFRYLGPAQVTDLQRWLAGSRADAAATVAALGDEVLEVAVAGRSCLALATSLPRADDGLDPDQVLLLPPDDVYISRMVKQLLVPDSSRARRLWPQAPPPGALIVGGEVCGTWRRRQGRVEITVWPEARVAERHRLRAESIAAGWPLGTTIEVTWVAPDV
ncbi:MAG: crosslink repair DNA glycosylase YcaQ family protein [Acidimicrobiia bacterium]|nr:crosslink repair DNA glycosylase YcaQ family protein [Acidimicrobiia bacterium]